jgi:hypothetical protein
MMNSHKIPNLNLIDTTGRELQSRMSYSDIDIYLKGFSIAFSSKQTSGANSKWVCSKEILSDKPDDLIISLADELELEHAYKGTKSVDLSDSKFWLPNYFPHGFIGKYQGLQAKDRTVSQVASALFEIILSHLRTRTKMLDCFVSQFLASGSMDDAKHWLELLRKAGILPESHKYHLKLWQVMEEEDKEISFMFDDPKTEYRYL